MSYEDLELKNKDLIEAIKIGDDTKTLTLLESFGESSADVIYFNSLKVKGRYFCPAIDAAQKADNSIVTDAMELVLDKSDGSSREAEEMREAISSKSLELKKRDLFLAVKYGDPDIVAGLMQSYGKDLDRVLSCKLEKGRPSKELDYLDPVVAAAKGDNKDIQEMLMPKANRSLSIAMEYNDRKTVRALIEAGADPKKARRLTRTGDHLMLKSIERSSKLFERRRDSQRSLDLIGAIERGNDTELVSLLESYNEDMARVALGVDGLLPRSLEELEKSPVIIASQKSGNKAIGDILQKVASDYEMGASGHRSIKQKSLELKHRDLSLAVQDGNSAEVASLLESYGRDAERIIGFNREPCFVAEEAYENPVIAAAKGGNAEIIDMLITNPGKLGSDRKDVNIKYAASDALLLAIEANDTKAVKALIKSGADPYKGRGGVGGYSAYELADSPIIDSKMKDTLKASIRKFNSSPPALESEKTIEPKKEEESLLWKAASLPWKAVSGALGMAFGRKEEEETKVATTTLAAERIEVMGGSDSRFIRAASYASSVSIGSDADSVGTREERVDTKLSKQGMIGMVLRQMSEQTGFSMGYLQKSMLLPITKKHVSARREVKKYRRADKLLKALGSTASPRAPSRRARGSMASPRVPSR